MAAERAAREAKEAAEKLVAETRALAERAARMAAEEAREAAGALKRLAEDTAKTVAEKTRDVAEALKDGAKDAAAISRDIARDVGDAVRKAAQDAAGAAARTAQEIAAAARTDKAGGAGAGEMGNHGPWTRTKGGDGDDLMIAKGGANVMFGEGGGDTMVAKAKLATSESGGAGDDTMGVVNVHIGADGDDWLVATAAGAVGVDLDADAMTCDQASWERMAPRLGRVTRRGDLVDGAPVVVMDLTAADTPKRPDQIGERERLGQTRTRLGRLPTLPEGTVQAGPGAIRDLPRRALIGATLVVDARLDGLVDGLLAETAAPGAPETADGDDGWISRQTPDGSPLSPLRLKNWRRGPGDDAPPRSAPLDARWRFVRRHGADTDGEGAPRAGCDVHRWRGSASEGDQASRAGGLQNARPEALGAYELHYAAWSVASPLSLARALLAQPEILPGSGRVWAPTRITGRLSSPSRRHRDDRRRRPHR